MKPLLLSAGILMLACFSSCKKDWACQCNTNGVVTTHEIDNETLLNARSKCKSYEGSVGGISTTCSIQ